MPLHSLVASFKRYRRHVSAASLAATTTTAADQHANTETLQHRLLDVFLRFWDLGFTAFGGPPVHFQILHRRFVEGGGEGGDCEGAGRKWLDEQTVS